MKKCLLVIAALILWSCSSDENKQREKVIFDVDKMPVTRKALTLETDSLGNPIDTVKIEIYKDAPNGKKRYQEVIKSGKKGISKDVYYYTSDGQILQSDSYFSEDTLFTRYVNLFNPENEIKQSYLIHFGDVSSDTLWMDYTRTYFENGKEKELIISSHKKEARSNSSVIYSNEYGRPVKELTIVDGDTLRFQTWEYHDSILFRQSVTDFYDEKTRRVIFYFGEGEKVLTEKTFQLVKNDSIQTKESTNYFLRNQKVRTIEINCLDGSTKYFRHLSSTTNLR